MLESAGKSLTRTSQVVVVGKQTMLKSEVVVKKTFNPRTEVWSPDVIEFFDKTGLDKSLGEQVLAKIRLLCPESVPIK